MLVACRLAGLSALEAYYADVNRRAQCGPPRYPNAASPPRDAGTARLSWTAAGIVRTRTPPSAAIPRRRWVGRGGAAGSTSPAVLDRFAAHRRASMASATETPVERLF